jgi:hypothetical protein
MLAGPFTCWSIATISGGEAFAYDIQSLHRATVIGEVTAGAANGLGAPPYYLSDHLRISVPDTILRNPYTETIGRALARSRTSGLTASLGCKPRTIAPSRR